MSISTTTNRVSYNGDGSSASFAFQYEFHSPADLFVYTWNSSRTVAISTKTLNVDYTVSGVQDAQNRFKNGANIIFNSSPSATDYIIITRDPSVIQPFNLQFNSVIPNQELVKALDRIALIEQRFNDLSPRTVRLKDAYPLSFNPHLPEKLVAGAPLIVGSSGLTIEMGVVATTGTSATTFFGITPVPNGGTGLDFSALSGVIYSPGNNTTFQNINNSAPGYVLTSNGSSAPTFQAFAVSLINSGTIAVAFGGTGVNSITPNALIYASGATQMSSMPLGGTDQPLVGNTGAPPSFQSINLASNSSVKNILAQTNGGTGTQSSFPQYALVYQSGVGSYGPIPSDTVGKVLTSNGSSAPTYQSPGSKVLSFFSDLSSETLTNSTDTAFLSGATGTLEFYSTALNGGKELLIKHQGSSFVQYILQAATSQIIVGMDGAQNRNYSFYTAGESGKFVINGSSWIMTEHNTLSGILASNPISVTGETTNPAKGTVTSDVLTVERNGRFAIYTLNYGQTVAGSSGSGFYRLNLSGTSIVADMTSITANSSISVVTCFSPGGLDGFITGWHSGPTGFTGTAVLVGSSHFRIAGIIGVTAFAAFGSGNLALSNAIVNLSGSFKCPVLGWNP